MGSYLDIDDVVGDHPEAKRQLVVMREAFAEMELEVERLRNVFRVNILRLAPETPHSEIDRVLNGEPDH